MSVLRRLLMVVLVLSTITGGWQVTLRLVRPECCATTPSCCPADHTSDCCQRKLEVSITGKPDDATQPHETVQGATLLPALSSLGPLTVWAPLERAPARATTMREQPPPRFATATTVLRF